MSEEAEYDLRVIGGFAEVLERVGPRRWRLKCLCGHVWEYEPEEPGIRVSEITTRPITGEPSEERPYEGPLESREQWGFLTNCPSCNREIPVQLSKTTRRP
jgi:hypothetical protein